MTVFAFAFVDIFDTLGTLMGTGARADFLDKDGRLPKIKEAMIVDAVGTVLGAVVGTSTVTTYVAVSYTHLDVYKRQVHNIFAQGN